MITNCFFCDYIEKYKNAETLKIPAFFLYLVSQSLSDLILCKVLIESDDGFYSFEEMVDSVVFVR